jgi:cell division protein FtsL
MKAYDYPEKEKRDQEKQRILEAVNARLAHHEKVTRITLTLALILAGLSLALLATHLFNHSN